MKHYSAIVALIFFAGADAFTPATIVQRKIVTALNLNLERETGKSQLDPAVLARYESLPFPSDKVLAEYVWVDAVGNLRSKTRTLPVERVS
jgi:glutamine synthetase